MDDDSKVTLKLSLLVFNNKKEVCGVLESFLYFWKIYEKRKFHNVFSILINPRFKNLCLVFSFIGYEYDFLLLRNMIENNISYAYEILSSLASIGK
jgi:hypothetical protein